MIEIGRKSISAAALVLMMTVSSVAGAQNSQIEQDPVFSEVQRLFDARQFDEAKSQLTAMSLSGELAVAKYLWLSRVQLELGAGIAAETAIERARELNADYALTAVPYAKALLVQGKYSEALAAMRGVTIPKHLQGQAFIVSGDANFALGAHEDALHDYNLAIETDDSSFQPYLGLARLALRDSNLENARDLANEAAKRDPNNTMVQYTLGLISRYSGDFSAAEQYFLESITLFPSNVMANIEMASIRINQNRIADAETYLDTVFTASPSQPMAIYLSAVILATRSEFEEAELLLLRVPQLTENYLPAIYVRGLVAYQLGKNEAATAALEQVLRVRPSNKPARMALAGTYANQQRPRAALRTLQPLLQSESEVDTAVLSMAAAAAIAAGEVERGKLLYERVAENAANSSSPSVTGIQSKLAMAQFASGDRQDAVNTISTVSANIGTEIRELGIMASMQIRNADLTGAATTIDKIIETAPDRALGYNMRGTLAYKEGDYGVAVSSYSQALSRNPEYYTALRNRGLAYFRMEDFGKAEVDLKNLLNVQPNDARSKAILGKTLLTVGKAEEAVTYFKDAIRAIPNSVSLSADYSQALAEAGNTTRAISQARETAKKGSDRPDVLRRMGLLLLDLDQAAAAERPLSRHVAFLPDSGNAHLLHGRALLSLGLFTGAKISFDRAKRATTDTPPEAVMAWYLFATDALALKQEDALRQLPLLDLTARPHDIDASVVGDILLHSGQAREAEAAYRAVFSRDTAAADVAIGLARALSAQGRGADAIKFLEDYVKDQPAERLVRAELAARFEALGNFEEAANQYREILRNGVADAATAARLAALYLKLNNNQSIRLVEQAFLISPDDPYILDVHGWVMLQAGRNTSRAVKSLEKAVRRSPSEALYKYHLGMAYLAQNRRGEARRTLTQAINLNPDFDGADEARRQIALLNRSLN